MFYSPFVVNVGEIPTIVYPSKGLESVMGRDQPGALLDHLRELYDRNSTLKKPIIGDPNYNIDVVWSDGDIMTDVWIFARLGEWDSGPLVDVETFRGMNPETKIGKGCGNSLGMIGRENDRLAEAGYDLQRYLEGPRAELPARLLVGKHFEVVGNI